MTTASNRTGQAAALTRRSALLAGGCTAVLAFALPLAGCGGGDSALDVPYITFVFEGVVTNGGTSQIVQLNLNTTAAFAGKSSGSYDTPRISIRNPITGTSSSFDANGTFSGNSLTLNVPTATAPLATAYTGAFTAPDTIVLTPTTAGLPTIRLVRVDNSFRPALDQSTWVGTDASQRAWTIHFFSDPAVAVPGGTESPLSSASGTELLNGDDLLAGQANGTLSGYATMRRLEITITRNGTPVALSGVFGPAGSTPPPISDTPLPAMTLTFSDGSSLKRTSAVPTP